MVSPNEPTGFENYTSKELSDNIAHEIIAAASFDNPNAQAACLDLAAVMNEELQRRGA